MPILKQPRLIFKNGKPQTFYSDKHGVFRVNAKEAKGGDQVTQFGRALQDLNTDIINANTCEAKGRVERANKTLQDRLINEMRLRGISDLAAGNDYLREFIERYNEKFAKPAAMDSDIHRPLQQHELDILDDIFCWQEDRTLSNSLTLEYDRVKYIIEDTEENRQLRRNPGAIVQNERLGNVLAYIKQQQDLREPEGRSKSCPRRYELKVKAI